MSTKKKGDKKKRAQRATSNVFAMFDQAQIQEFKEAFNLIDQNRDGFIDKEDLKDMYASMGKSPSDEYTQAMLDEAAGAINFTMFLTLMGEKMSGTDPEDVIRNAFASFDPEGDGRIDEDRFKQLLMGLGDKFSEDEYDDMVEHAPMDKEGNLLYIEFVKRIKYGEKED